MAQAFYQIFDMSLVASLVILVVLLARLLLKRAPQVISYALWLVVLFRLLCPWSPESEISVIPSDLQNTIHAAASELDAEPADVAEGVLQIVQDVINHDVGTVRLGEQWENGNHISLLPKEVLLLAASYVWPIGMAVMILYNLISLHKLRGKLVGAVHQANHVYLADHILSPFVFGIFRPKIYLPSNLSEQEYSYILLHEQTHIKRGDHIWKLLGFLALTLHWFNPLVWLAFFCACKDMETSCDETVIKRLGSDIRADYSASLLRLATGRRILAGAPLAFGEGSTKSRIRHILKYKKPALWIALTALILVLLLTIVLALNPVSTPDYFGTRYLVSAVTYEKTNTSLSDHYSASPTPSYIITEDGSLYTKSGDTDWSYAGTLSEVDLDRQELNSLFDPSNNHIQAIMDDVHKVYEADWQFSGSVPELHYYLLEYKPFYWNDSALYLAVGQERSQMQWLFQLKTANDGVDLEYLEFAIGHRNSLPEEVRCFAVYEDPASPGWVLAGFISDNKIGMMAFTYQDNQRRRTYVMKSGVMGALSGGDYNTVSRSYYVGFPGFDTEYIAFVSNNPVLEQNMELLGDWYQYFKFTTCPLLTVWKVPTTLSSRIDRLKQVYFARSETPSETASCTEDAVPVDQCETMDTVITSVSDSRLIYDLTNNAAVTLPQDKLPEHGFWTNSTSITVTASQAEGSITLKLCDAETGVQIATHTLTQGESVAFTNLTSVQTYYLETESQANTMLTITD